MRLRAILLAAGLAAAPAVTHAGTAEGLEAYAEGDYELAVAELEVSAETGEALAQFLLGAMYGGGQGVERDPVKAAEWYRLAADQGHANAQFNLGTLYASGQGLAQDYTEALRWFLAAADHGFANAQYNIGHMYREGLGVEVDPVLAFAWWNLAASAGSDVAKRALAEVALELSPDQLVSAGKAYGALLERQRKKAADRQAGAEEQADPEGSVEAGGKVATR